MNVVQTFHDKVVELLDDITNTQQERIAAAATILTDTVARDGLIYVFGSGGHSYIASEDMAGRAGGLAPVHPVFDPGISVSFGGRRSSAIERLPGYAPAVLGVYPITSEDCIVIVNAYGINSATIDTALWAREKGIQSVGITSPGFSERVPEDHPARHPSGHNLHDVVDAFVDSKMPEKDAVLQFSGLAPWVSPVSTIVNSFVIQSLVGEVVKLLLERGITPPVFTSANIPGGDAANKELMEKYAPRIKFL